MARIKILDEDVYKKIAAGEVVERPLSVVKELVENSIDAGADNIKVEILEGGKKLIKVIDNGIGFDPDDIEAAFKNHSTSKITDLSDFDSLNTLGFRGEALPSILEVSKIEIKTSNNNDGIGIYCSFEQGHIKERQEIAHNRGTTIIVKDLFYNFPVRKKFLKTEKTELNRIISFLEPAAMENYNTSFEFIHNDRTVFIYKKAESLKERVYQLFGKDFLNSIQEVDFELDNYKLKGFVSKINTGISVKKHQYYFVNGRSIKEKTLIAALNNTFEKFLEKNRYPVGILSMDIPPHEVDVNIHPMKLEIKFVDSNSVYRFIKHAIESSFSASDEFTTHTVSTEGYGHIPNYVSRYHVDRSINRGRNGSSYMEGKDAQMSQVDFDQARLFSGDFLSEEDFILVGQYKNSYILVEKNEELLIVDQHNAQERINFDKLKKEYQENNITSISPLFPIIIDLTPSEKGQLDDDKKKLLEKIGFRMEPLSGNSFDVKAFPQILEERSIKDAILEVIHMQEEELNFEDKVLAEIACKSAIKINHKLYPDQMKTIVRNLFRSSNPYFCPHKRPIIIDFTLEEIEKRLKRK